MNPDAAIELIGAIGPIPPWRSSPDNLCHRTSHPDAWFDRETRDLTIRICRRCPNRRPCRDWAVDESGVWGGTSRHERQRRRATH